MAETTASKYCYYPGCSLEATAKEYNQSVHAAARLLDVELVELEDWNCCGASSGHCTDPELSLALPARNLALAEKEGHDLAVSCAACFLRFKQTNHDLRADDTLRQRIEQVIDAPYRAETEVRHVLDIFAREVGLEEIERRVKKPLKGLKLAAYYGCYLVRPPKVTQLDDPNNPMIMDNLLTAIGAEPLDWTHKVECCGGNLLLARTDIVVKLCNDICQAALDTGASAIVTACPLCQANLELRQTIGVPTFYFSELLALSLGASAGEMKGWWKCHIQNPVPVLKEQDLI
ncbi:MAG: CoB--CoM heterodisulfide reductase iron-sulfur subunit B family protein [Dehalococcoidales bacterium]|nr:CoB--CoM heterodisulfide reductase iron-sulfur subunit B family protein [Dehalococcoidales bacterium]